MRNRIVELQFTRAELFWLTPLIVVAGLLEVAFYLAVCAVVGALLILFCVVVSVVALGGLIRIGILKLR